MVAETSGGGSHGRGGGGACVFQCRHQQRVRLQAGKRWQLTLILLVLLCASSCGVVPEANRERPLLLYIPMHVSEPLEHLQELCDRTLSRDPWVAAESNGERERNIQLAFDILIVVSGPSEASRNATERFDAMRLMLVAATKNLLPSSPRIYLDYKALGVDKYDLNVDDEDKDAEWVSGPNSVFYDAFAEGGQIYEKYVRFYALVQQLETDVCALRGGWLSALLRPMLVGEGGASDSSSFPSASSSPSPSSFSPSSSSSLDLIIMSGPTIRSSCMYVVKYDECHPFEGEATHMTGHVNGNAVYRTGDLLQQVLKSAIEQFANSEPFDLAIYHVLKASNASATLAHSNPLYHNTATLLDRDWFLDFRYHGVDDLAVLHAPRRLRADGLKAVATRAQAYLPATTVVLSEESIVKLLSGGNKAMYNTLLLNFKAAADDLHLSGVIYIALTEDVFLKASRVVPLQVLPAFGMRQNGAVGGGEAHPSSLEAAATNDSSALSGAAYAAETAAAAANSTAAAAAASADHKSFVLTWPPTSPWPATRLLATIAQLVTQGYSPLVVDAASVPLQNYDVVLYGFPKDAIFFADTEPGVGDEARQPFRVKNDDKARGLTVDVETMYAPASAYAANFLQAWAVTTLQRQLQEQEGRAAAFATSALLTIAQIKALAACRLGNMSGFTPCPWRGVSVETLPIHLFPPQAAFFGSGWTRRARKHALFLDMSSSSGGDGGGGGVDDGASSPSSSSTGTILRLRYAGKWHASARCPTYSVLSRLPRDLTHDTVFEELTLHAEFLSFVRERKVACAVLPGFRLPSTGATLPVDALLDLETIHASAGTQATILPRIQDMEEASRGYVAFDLNRLSKSKGAKSSSSQHSRNQEALLPRDDVCSEFSQFARPFPSSPTACLSRDVSLALSGARSALPSSYICAHDTQRTVEEVALVGLRGARGFAEVAAKVMEEVFREAAARASLPSSFDAATVFLTGTWRLLPRGSFGNGVSSSSYPSSSRSGAVIVTLSDLHLLDQKLQCAQDLNPKMSPLPDEAWAGILEALLCRYSAISVNVSRQLSSDQLRKKNDLKRSASRRNRNNNRSSKNFAELVATHIPPLILLEDVTAFAKWLARPDRANLMRGRSLQFLADEAGGPDVSATVNASTGFPSASQQHHRRHNAALLSLSMLAPTIAETRADYAFLPVAADARTGKLLPWSSVTEIGELYRVRPALLPPSLAAMMHPKAVLEFLLSPESSTLPLNVPEASRQNGNTIYFNHVSQDAAFRTTVAALGRKNRHEAALLKRKKKLWVMSTTAAPRHHHSREILPVSSVGASDDVVVRLNSGTG